MVILADSAEELNLRVLLPLIYIIPSYILYATEIYIMFINSKTKIHFKSAFYYLFLMNCIMSMLDSITFYIFYRTTAAPLFVPIYRTLPEKNFLITLILFMTYYCKYAMDFTDMTMSFNRLTIIAFKFNYKRFWDTALKYFIICIIFLPFVFTFHLWLTDVRIKIVNPKDPYYGYQWDEFHKEAVPWASNAIYMSSIAMFCGSVSFICNFIVGIQLVLKKKQAQQNDTHGKIAVQEKKLIFYTFLTLTGQMIFFTHQLTWVSSQDLAIGTALFKTLAYIMDYITLNHAWFMFIINKKLRIEIYKTFFGVDSVKSIVSIRKTTLPTNVNGLSLASSRSRNTFSGPV